MAEKAPHIRIHYYYLFVHLGLLCSCLWAMPIEEKIDWLLENMTLAEKINHLNTTPREQHPTSQQAYDKRHHLPGFVACEGTRGVRPQQDKGICFPVPLQLAATWNESLMEQIGGAWAQQLKHNQANQLYAPGLNVIRHPLSGRNAEYLGEDPFLIGKLGAAQVRGLQSEGCLATAKHFALAPFQTGRSYQNITVSPRVLREIYLPGFRRCVQEGNVQSVMTTYHSMNGYPATTDTSLLNILQSWGFTGYVLSNYRADLVDAASALNAGTHVERPGWTWYQDYAIAQALRNNTLQSQLLDQRLRTVLRIKLNADLYNPSATPTAPRYNVMQQRTLARQAATQGIVLLKNEQNLLPLKRHQSVALIGPFANSNLILGNQGSSAIVPERLITLKQAFQEKLLSQMTYVPGCPALTDLNAQANTAFPCHASYWNNLTMEGPPELERPEESIQKLSFSGIGGAIATTGVIGQGLSFMGQSSLMIGQTPSYTASDDFTWSFWVFLAEPYPDEKAPLWSSTLGQRAGFHVTPTGLQYQVSVGHHPMGGHLSFQIPSQLWVHVAIVRRSGYLTVYIDGEKQEAAAMFPRSIPSMSVTIGGDVRDRAFANCIMDEIAMYDWALQSQDLEHLTQKFPLSSGRVFYQDCEDLSALAHVTESYPGITDPLNMSARWSGTFSPDQTGKYHFNLTSNGGLRFYVDGHLIFDQMQEAWGHGIARQCWIPMQLGQSYQLTIEYANWFGHNRGDSGFVKFDYRSPSIPSQYIAAAVSAAQTHDVAIVTVGIPQQILQGEANDNETYSLPAYQEELLQAVTQANPKTVVILSSAGGCDMQDWAPRVPALLESFFPGQEAGYALYDILYGEVNPSGKLPLTYPISLDELPIQTVQPILETSVSGIGYRLYERLGIKPQFAFGHGLSYTTFTYSSLRLKPLGRDTVQVSFTLKNTGERSGAEVAQVYVGDVQASVERPVSELKGFKKIPLAPGQSQNVTLWLDAWAFSFFDEDAGHWRIEPGTFVIKVGSSVQDIRLSGQIKLP